MPIEEIVVTGKKPSGGSGFSPFRPSAPNPFGDSLDIEEMKRDKAEDEAEAEQAFLPPVLVPVIEEIVVTASRTSQLAAAARAARFNVAGIAGWLVGSLAAEILRDVSQARLDVAGELATRTIPARPDTPVRVMEPEVIPEIVVTARRQELVRPPMPQFFSVDDDPFVMQTVYPRYAEPAPSVSPIVDAPLQIPMPTPLVAPLPLATPLPLAMPQPFPQPFPQPSTQPFPQPSAQPFPQPAAQPMPQPSVQPGTGTVPKSLTGSQTGVLPFTGLQAGLCPPATKTRTKCKKDKDKRRNKCYRQLVKQARYGRADKISKWAEIDCDTGRTIREIR